MGQSKNEKSNGGVKARAGFVSVSLVKQKEIVYSADHKRDMLFWSHQKASTWDFSRTRGTIRRGVAWDQVDWDSFTTVWYLSALTWIKGSDFWHQIFTLIHWLLLYANRIRSCLVGLASRHPTQNFFCPLSVFIFYTFVFECMYFNFNLIK